MISYIQDAEPIEISKGVYIVDLKKFTDIYNARKDLLPILSDGVNERMELYKANINDNNTTTNI